MNKSEICRKIYDFCLPLAVKYEAPTAYINIVAGGGCPLTKEELCAEFDRIKWDTPLSTAELSIKYHHKTDKTDTSLTIDSLVYFEEDGRGHITVKVEDGKILD